MFTLHLDVMRRRRQWFQHVRVHMVLWWIPMGQVPSPGEAEQRLEHVPASGPTPYAFTFKSRFMPGRRARVIDELIGCPA